MQMGRKTKYNRQAVINDLLDELDAEEIAKKHKITLKTVSLIKSRYINGQARIVPPLEQCIRHLEKGNRHDTAINKWGEEMYKEALTWLDL